MSKYSGTAFSILLVDGYNLAPAITDAVSMGQESISQQTNSFGATSEGHTPMNIEKGTLTAGSGFFDAAADALNTALGGISHISRIVCAGIEGNIIGKHFMGFEGAYTQKYDVMDKKDGLTMANATYLISGETDEGIIVQHLATFTATWDTKTGGANAPDTPIDYTTDPENRAMDIASNSLANPTVVTMKSQHGSAIPHGLITGDKVLFSGSNSTPSINGIQTATVISPTTFSVPVNVTVAGTAGSFVRAGSDAGGVGYLQVTAYSGSTGFVDKIMHSADDVTYAALVTFADLGAVYTPGSTNMKQRISVLGFVDRYLSNLGTLTGAGSVTAFSGFARN